MRKILPLAILAIVAIVSSAGSAQEQIKRPSGVQAPQVPAAGARDHQRPPVPGRVRCATPPRCAQGEPVCTRRAVCYSGMYTDRAGQDCVAYTCLQTKLREPSGVIRRP